MSSDSSEDDHVYVVQKKLGVRSSIKKKDGRRKILKAEREKLKRDHMNDLFSELGKAIEPANQNLGKSSTLTNTIRIIKDLLAQVEALKKENSTLLAESQYVAVEKNELKEENRATEAQISKLKSQMEERLHSQSLWRSDPDLASPHTTQFSENGVIMPVIDTATQKVSFVAPLQYPKPWSGAAELPPNVSKPHARYPSPSHAWPFNILSESQQPRVD